MARALQSAAWDASGVLVYTTLNHIKYCLPNGDSGIIRTLDVPVYITKVTGDVIHCLDRDGKNRQIQVRLGMVDEGAAKVDLAHKRPVCEPWEAAVAVPYPLQSPGFGDQALNPKPQSVQLRMPRLSHPDNRPRCTAVVPALGPAWQSRGVNVCMP